MQEARYYNKGGDQERGSGSEMSLKERKGRKGIFHRRGAEGAEKKVFSLKNLPNSANSASLW